MSFSIEAKYTEIAQQLPGFEPRPVQAAMVKAIYEALQSGETIAIEAGTGSGKSFGYLIPSLMSSHRPVVVSTGTIALQEQLMDKDIPFVAKAAGMDDLKIKLVKGRRNYICIQKLGEFEKSLSREAPERLYVTCLKTALNDGWDGDKATLDLEVPEDVWEEVQSDSEDCLGKKCVYFQHNPYFTSRKDIAEADVLVVNHALYLQDLVTGQLPPHEMIVFDEAHHLKAYALKAFTARIGKFATHKLLRKIHRRLQAVPDAFQHAIYQTEAEILQWLFQQSDTRQTFKIFPDARYLSLIQQQITVLSELSAWLSSFDVQQIPLLNELEVDVVKVQRTKLLDQLSGLILRWEFFLSGSSMDRVNWAEVKHDRLYYELKSTPLNIAEQFRLSLWAEKTGVLTSATLATDKNLQAIRRELGIPVSANNPDLVLDSPFDYATQCELYLPLSLPEPNDPFFAAAATDEIVRVLNFTEGRAFVLFTSYSAMQKVGAAVIPQIRFPSKMQGDLPKHRLIEWFKSTPNSVLFATATFWEGIDIPGEALSCVIIDKLPFPMPDEPVHSAMVDRLKRLGEDWFNGYVLPETIIRLKQGVGRLIRSKKDTGIVAILDPRVRTKGYGKKVLRSLPPARSIHHLSESSFHRRSRASHVH